MSLEIMGKGTYKYGFTLHSSPTWSREWVQEAEQHSCGIKFEKTSEEDSKLASVIFVSLLTFVIHLP